jgi:hypothetical protein
MFNIIFMSTFGNSANAAIEVAGQKNKEIKRLEDRLFALGEMAKAPCFCCGYNGPRYFQPDQHPCAKRHHALSNEPALPTASALPPQS